MRPYLFIFCGEIWSIDRFCEIHSSGGSANVIDATDNVFMHMKWIVIHTETAPAPLAATDPRDPTQSELACVFLTVKPICCDTAVKRTEHARTVMSRLTLSVAWLRNTMMSLSALAGLFCPQPVRWQRAAPMCHELRSARNTRWRSATPHPDVLSLSYLCLFTCTTGAARRPTPS